MIKQAYNLFTHKIISPVTSDAANNVTFKTLQSALTSDTSKYIIDLKYKSNKNNKIYNVLLDHTDVDF